MKEVFLNEEGTYSHFGLRLVALKVSSAQPKFHYVDIPAGDGQLDLTEALAGETKYKDREVEIILRIKNNEHTQKLEEINELYHGKRIKIRTYEKEGYYLVGRANIEFERLNYHKGNIIIHATCEPWYYKNNLTTRTFTIGSSGEANVDLINSRKRVIPVVETDKQITIKYGSMTRVIQAGTHRITSLVLIEGDNSIQITGTNGTKITFQYQEGAL